MLYEVITNLTILTRSESSDNFLKNLAKELPDILKHDYLAKSQAGYLEELKKDFKDGEFLVTLDFSENYTFHYSAA